jgi:serine/threonine-protein kinase RsbW
MTPVTLPLPPFPDPMTAEKRTVSATLDRLSELREFAIVQAREAGLENRRLAVVDLVVEEAAVNVISHAYPDATGVLEVTCRADGKEFVIEIIDEGVPFDPTSADDPVTTLPLDERTVGGLGLLLIRRSCDGLSWRRESGRNILTCRFHLHLAPESRRGRRP